jgi:hypothetical protein
LGGRTGTSVAVAYLDREERTVAIVVVLLPASEQEPSLRPAAVAELARLGVTSVSLVSDDQTLALVVEGWAFDPAGSAEAVVAAVAGPRVEARTLHPLLHMAISTAAPHGGVGKE